MEEIAAIDESFNEIADLAKRMSHCCGGRETNDIIGAAKMLIAWADTAGKKRQRAEADVLSKMAMTGLSMTMPMMSGFEPDIADDLKKVQKPPVTSRGSMNDWVKDELEN